MEAPRRRIDFAESSCSGTFQQFFQGMTNLSTVQLCPNLGSFRHSNFKAHSLGGVGGIVRVPVSERGKDDLAFFTLKHS